MWQAQQKVFEEEMVVLFQFVLLPRASKLPPLKPIIDEDGIL